MHDTAYKIGGLVMQTYCPRANAKILEIGSYSVNGALRDHALPTNDYVGLDIKQGPGVDVVSLPGEPFPFEDDLFDLVLASSVFEHDDAFWLTFMEMVRKTKDGGHLYISAPSNGTVHRYPQDNWRFYPDSGRALSNWSYRQGVDIQLIESFVAERDGDIWNDFVAVFRKGSSRTGMNSDFVHSKIPCSNVLTWQSGDVLKQRDEPQDMVLISAERAQTLALRDELSDAQNTLRQRQEEITQAWAALSDEQAKSTELHATLDHQADEFNTLSAKLSESDAWVFRLAEHRQRAEQRADRLERSLSSEIARRHSAEQTVERLNAETARHVAALQSRVVSLSSELRSAEEDRSAAQGQLRDRFGEIAKLTDIFSQTEKQLEEGEHRTQWLREVNDRLMRLPRWWGLLPARWRQRKLLVTLKNRGLFDGDAYLGHYPDVANAGMSPLRHYILHGMAEGRRHFS